MELISNRKQAIPLVMEWIKANLPLNETVQFTRDSVCEKTNTTPAIVSRVLLMLSNKGYLNYKQYRNTPGAYRLIKDIASITTKQMDMWIKEYQQGKDRERKERLESVTLESNAPVAEATDQSELAAQPNQNGYRFVSAFRDKVPTEGGTPSLFNEKATETTKSAVEESETLTPGQRLLREAQALLEEENRIKQEEEERQKATQAPVATSVQDAGTLSLFESRLNLAEQRVNALLGLFNQTAQALSELTATEAVEEPIAPTTRGLLIRLVNSYAAAERRTEHETWKYLYGQFALRHGFDVYANTPGKGERNFLSVIEKSGHLDSLYGLARKLFVLPELK